MARNLSRSWLVAGVASVLVAGVVAQGCGSGAAPGASGMFATVGAGSGSGSGGASGHGGSTASLITTSTSSTGSGMDGGKVACAMPCDPATQICSHGNCVPRMPCKTDNDCSNDSYCDASGSCSPWDGNPPGYDPNCINPTVPGILSPRIRCEFSAPPPGDPFPLHVDVQATPIVVNFHKPAASGPPSIVASFTATVPAGYTENQGVIRVLSGKDCSLEDNLGGVDLDGNGFIDWSISSSPVAVGDLDGDGVAEIVAYGYENGVDGYTLAFTKKLGKWKLLWKAPPPAGMALGHWAGPSIHDLDDDGIPEVIREGAVFDGLTGALKGPAPANYASYSAGNFSVLANLDQDPLIELTNGQFVWSWVKGVGWQQKPGFPGASPSTPGYVAVADFGAYGKNVPPKNPEIVVIAASTVTIYAIDGTIAYGPIAVPGNGGGPPTVGDFDGDGLPEVAIAGQASYTLFDIDCTANPRPGGKCVKGPCDYLGGGPCPASSGIAWSRQSQDISSNITGSSVFDFQASGISDAIYADECFTRVYDGQSGDVVFSQYRSSCTWNENPIVADVEGNFRSNLVVPSNKACSTNGLGIPCKMLDANGVDVTFAGLHCKTGADCVSGLCDSGLCRCATGAQCCGAMDVQKCLLEGYACTPPPPGTPGAGNTCRAAHPQGVSGIRVYADANDNWVRSRTIWNQHAYAVTNVNEDGTIPKTSAWLDNWLDPTLNNFRENVPGTANGKATGDATAGASHLFSCVNGAANLTAPVCNRGASPIGAGLSVGFYEGATKLCGATTATALAPGQCETVGCTWASPPATMGGAIDVTVKADDNGAYKECKTGNDKGTVFGVFCLPLH